MNLSALWWLLLAPCLVCLVLPPGEARPNYIECTSSEECGPGKCCMLGMNRYSVPTCLPLSEASEPCRPWDQAALNTSVWYPEGGQVRLTNVHRQFCPCSAHLSCSLVERVCIRPDELDNQIPRL